MDTKTGQPACGGMLCAFWGTEIGSRREQAMIAWDYDVDLAAFVTEDFDFASLWRQACEILTPLGLRCIEHDPDFKYRVCPEHALAHNDWRERYQLARLQNPQQPRTVLSRIAKDSKTRNEPLQFLRAHGCLPTNKLL